jgi:hypothetical protein
VRYHVEIKHGFRLARALNLTEAELNEQILGPWRRGAVIALGDRHWTPAESELRVYEGPELDSTQLALGQGWTNAQRSGEDATRRLLAAPPADGPAAVAVLAQSEAARQAAVAAVEQAGLRPLAWETVRAALLAPHGGKTPEPVSVAGALVAFDLDAPRDDAAWWLDAGLALGGFGWRALLGARGSGALPAPLDACAALPLADADKAAQALLERLRMTGRRSA